MNKVAVGAVRGDEFAHDFIDRRTVEDFQFTTKCILKCAFDDVSNHRFTLRRYQNLLQAREVVERFTRW